MRQGNQTGVRQVPTKNGSLSRWDGGTFVGVKGKGVVIAAHRGHT